MAFTLAGCIRKGAARVNLLGAFMQVQSIKGLKATSQSHLVKEFSVFISDAETFPALQMITCHAVSETNAKQMVLSTRAGVQVHSVIEVVGM